jgi:SAM-dependent MidA family methyltransferase
VRLRFDEYQDRCLYDPDHGFYVNSTGAGARGGDFLTSPEVGPLFGVVLARWLDSVWDDMGGPSLFDVVEVGAGRGALAASILRAAPRCMPALRYVAVEQSASLRARAGELLGDRAAIRATLPDEPLHGVVLANELLDNLPVRIVERDPEGGWSEVHVDVDDVGVHEVLVPMDAQAVASLPEAARSAVEGGGRVPVLERAAAWVDRALASLASGRLLCLDYGVRTTAELVARPWLRTYAGHERGTDPYETPMERDITVDIAVDQLPGTPTVVTQAELLTRHGIDELVEEGRVIWEERAHLGDLAAMMGRSRINEAAALSDPSGLGAFLAIEWTTGPSAVPGR